MKRRILAIVLVISIFLSTFVGVYADNTFSISELQNNLKEVLMNNVDDAKAMLKVTADLIKFAVSKFKDVKDSDWFAEAVGKLNVLKILDGMPDGSFNSQGQVTRAQFVKMLVQAMEYKKVDSVSFSDLRPFPTSKPHWASVYIETALRNGVIVKDEIGDNFFPDVPLTRRDMGIMMFRALKLQPSTGENPFVDLTEANGSLTKLYEEYLIRGNIEGGKRLYKPEGLTTRAEAAVIISRMVEYKENPQAFKDKMKRQENLHDVTANGVPVRLYEYMDGTKGRTFKECFEEYYNFIQWQEGYEKTNGYIYPEIATYGGSDTFLKYQFGVVKQYMKANYNIDYRTAEKTYKQNIGDSMGRGLSITLDNKIAEYKKYKVVSKSEFLTDYDLIHKYDGYDTTVRGTLRIKLESPTSPEYAKKLGIEVGKWYDIDMNIRLNRDSWYEYWYVDKKGAVGYLADPIQLNR